MDTDVAVNVPCKDESLESPTNLSAMGNQNGFIVDILPRYPCISIPFGLPGIINPPFPVCAW